MSHTCHAEGCDQATPPKMFMCKRHWFMLPKEIRDSIWEFYVPGQERRKDPSKEYLAASQWAIDWLAKKEGLRVTETQMRLI